MLLHIREKAQSWIAFAIVGLLILGLSTVAWDAYFSPDPEVPVASVNGEKITSEEFQREYQQQRSVMQSRLRAMLGETADISQFIPDESIFKDNVLKRLQEEELAYQATTEAGYRVGDSMLAQQIRSFEAFQTDGQFDPAVYKQWLRQNYYSPGGFEDMLRRDVVVQQYRLGIVGSAWVAAAERDALIKLQMQQRDVAYAVIPAEGFMDTIEVSDEEIQAFYDDNKRSFATEEKISIEYLELSLADLSKNVDVNEEALRERYQDHQSEFGVPEERRTRHILIEVAGDATDEDLAQARSKAESLVAALRDGADFAELAKQSSDDFGSANAGGDLGYMTKDSMMDPALADAAFSLAKGEVSEPVKSAYGYHVIEVTDIKPSTVKDFAEVRDQLEKDYRLAEAEDMFFEQGELLANLSFENPDTLEIAAEELALPIKTTAMFSRRSGEGIATNDDIRAAAFSEDVLRDGLNSQAMELSGDKMVVLRVKDHEEVTTRPLSEVRDQIASLLRQQKAQDKARNQGQELLAQVRDSGDFEASASAQSLALLKPEPLKRNSQELAPELLSKIFQMGYPLSGQSLFDGISLSNGDYVVIELREVLAGEADEAQVNALTAQRENYYGTNEYLGAMADMRGSAEITLYPENL